MIARKILPTLVVFITAVIYFSVVCPYHFHFQEQYQLFLWNSDYAREVMRVPGGFADYLGQFVTQFYYVHGAGAVILACCLTLAHSLLLANLRNRQILVLSLTLFPLVFLWIYLQNDHAMLGTGMAYLLSLALALAVNRLSRPFVHTVAGVALLFVLYWAVGAMVWVFTSLVVIHQAYSFRHRNRWLIILLMATLTLILPWMASLYVPYPLEALANGIHYFRFPADHPFLIQLIMLTTVGVAAIPHFSLRRKSLQLLAYGAGVASVAVNLGMLLSQTNPMKDETLSYSYWGRTGQWEKIVERADQKPPQTVVGVCMLNLALGMRGEMENRMMNYFQNGAGGLIPTIQNDFVFSPIAGEIYYQLGLTYLAQQQMMEAMEACPDMQKSAYIYRRLAETNLIHGAYPVAYKYLKALQQTLFYKDWATQTLQLLGNEEAINQHPEYGRLRRNSLTEDNFAMGSFLEQLEQMHRQRPQNQLAADYLKACVRLTQNNGL